MTTFPEVREALSDRHSSYSERSDAALSAAPAMLAHIDAQAAEIERLREALEQIASRPDAPVAYNVARAALEQTK